MLTLVLVGGLVYQMKRLSIGGILSGIAVSAVLGHREWLLKQNHDGMFSNEGFVPSGVTGNLDVATARYVDDILAFSTQYCKECVFHLLTLVYRIPLTPSSSHSNNGVPPVWLDMELYTNGVCVTLVPVNTDRNWLYCGEPRIKTTILW